MKGEGEGGLAFLSHIDTVPGQEDQWPAFEPVLKEGKLFGRGSCDMKGPLAATIMAAVEAERSQLKKPVFVVVAADEEIGAFGAKQVVAESQLFHHHAPTYGVVAEPTRMIPVYAHKGIGVIYVNAYGKAAHASTDLGISSNFLIAPFLAEMARLAQMFKHDESFMDHEFTPPTNGFNMVINDGNAAHNVTASQTTCTLAFRPMPNARAQDVVDLIYEKAQQYGLDINHRYLRPFYTAPDSHFIQAGCRATGISTPETVPFGTEAFIYQDQMKIMVLGPGNIAQAHTVGEWIDVGQLRRAVDVYGELIEVLCM